MREGGRTLRCKAAEKGWRVWEPGVHCPPLSHLDPPSPPSRYWVRLGEHSLSRLDWTEQIRRSGFSVTHPGYQRAGHSHDNDLRLLRLGTPVRLTRSVQLLPLPTTCAAAGTKCHISGWGITNQPGSKGASGSGLRTGKVWGGGREIRSHPNRRMDQGSNMGIVLWGQRSWWTRGLGSQSGQRVGYGVRSHRSGM